MKKLLMAVAVIVALGAGLVGAYAWQAIKGVTPQTLEAQYMTPADRFVDVAGARVRVREEGPADAPPIILLHGFTYSLETWDAWAAALSSDYRVIRYDLLGHGLTGPDPKQRYSPDERAAFLGDVMDALDVERAAIAGNSLGGLAAWKFAAAEPNRVSALILVSPGAFPANGVEDTPLEPPAAMAAYLRTAPEAGVRASADYVFADDSKVSDKRLTVLRDMMRRRGNGEAFVQSIEEFVLPDPTASLSRIVAPTLLLWGEQDAVIPVEQASRVAKAIPDARLLTYPGVGHAAQEEAAAQSVQDAKAFLDSALRPTN